MEDGPANVSFVDESSGQLRLLNWSSRLDKFLRSDDIGPLGIEYELECVSSMPRSASGSETWVASRAANPG
jgi:hypothetical protein